MMMNHSDKYLEETLLQARKHGLHTTYIQKLESERQERLDKERMFQTEVYRNPFHN